MVDKVCKNLVSYYDNLSFVSCFLVGMGLQYAERPSGLGICGFMGSLSFLFVVFLSLIYRNVLMRGATANFPILLAEPSMVTYIDLCLSLGMISYFALLLMLCIPQITSVVPITHNTSYPYNTLYSLVDTNHIPLIMVFITGLFIVGFFVFSVRFVVKKHLILEEAQAYYREKQIGKQRASLVVDDV